MSEQEKTTVKMNEFVHTRYWICQTPTMNIWIALHRMRCIDCLYRECKNTKEEYKAIVKSFPYPVGDCRCKDCRYYRIATGKKPQ